MTGHTPYIVKLVAITNVQTLSTDVSAITSHGETVPVEFGKSILDFLTAESNRWGYSAPGELLQEVLNGQYSIGDQLYITLFQSNPIVKTHTLTVRADWDNEHGVVRFIEDTMDILLKLGSAYVEVESNKLVMTRASVHCSGSTFVISVIKRYDQASGEIIIGLETHTATTGYTRIIGQHMQHASPVRKGATDLNPPVPSAGSAATHHYTSRGFPAREPWSET